MISRKKANQKLEMVVNNIGMMLLLGLILLITVGDISRVLKK
jgi:membrane-associated protease RseP (regulator of RpoE activity)